MVVVFGMLVILLGNAVLVVAGKVALMFLRVLVKETVEMLLKFRVEVGAVAVVFIEIMRVVLSIFAVVLLAIPVVVILVAMVVKLALVGEALSLVCVVAFVVTIVAFIGVLSVCVIVAFVPVGMCG